MTVREGWEKEKMIPLKKGNMDRKPIGGGKKEKVTRKMREDKLKERREVREATKR